MSYLTTSNIYQYQYSDGDDVTYAEVVAHLGDEWDDDTHVVSLRLMTRNGAFSAIVSSQVNDLPAASTAWTVGYENVACYGAWNVAPSALIQGF